MRLMSSSVTPFYSGYFSTTELRRMGLILTAFLAACTLLTAYPRQHIISGSMVPTIPVGKVVVADRLSYVVNQPKRGDIVVFSPVDGISDIEWSHRIIGLPGDRITTKNGVVTVNSQAIAHNTTSDPDGEVTVPAGMYYEKGDDIDAINGLVPASSVKAKVVLY